MAAPMLRAGRWHGAWSYNMEPSRARWVNGEAFGRKLQQHLGAIPGVTADTAPDRHISPECRREALGMGLGRDVWTVNFWFRCATVMDSERLNRAVTMALRDSGAGNDWSVDNVVSAMADCDTPHNLSAGDTLREAAQNTSLLGRLAVDRAFGDVCATYEAVSEDATPPAAAALDGAVANLASGGTVDSNNPQQIGQRPPAFQLPFNGPSIDWGTVKWVAIGVGGVVALAVVGYTARGIAQVFRET